jgi:FkbM family methyltransferase
MRKLNNFSARECIKWIYYQIVPRKYDPRYCKLSYSQEGEDILLSYFLWDKYWDRSYAGTYLEIGAHHPFRYSNSFLFYSRGWRGVCVDPIPDTKKLWRTYRPKDIFIEAVVSSEVNDRHLPREELVPFVVKHHSELSSLDAEVDISSGDYVAHVSKISLPRIVQDFLCNKSVDFMSIDVEGRELEILRTNDFGQFRPSLLCVEILSTSIELLNERDVHNLLIENDYSLVSKLCNSFIYRDNKL